MSLATRLAAIVSAVLVLASTSLARAAEEVDLLLVLSSDVSRSIDEPKFKLQRDGYAAAIADPRVIVGGSDGGAHVDMLDTFAMNTQLLGPVVRDRRMLTLEAAVHLLTGAPATMYGIVDRGLLREDAWADLFVFDSATVGPGRVEMRHDLPSGAGRLFSTPTGVRHVFVNGSEVVRDGIQVSGPLPGNVLRSGRDTRTVAVRSSSRSNGRSS